MNKNIRKITLLGIVMSQLSFASFAYESQNSTVSFTDASKHWAKAYIEELVVRKVVSGYPDGTFKPDGNITVAEFVKILIGELVVDESSLDINWYDKYIKKAKAEGIIVEEEFLDYDSHIKRKEAVRLIDRFLGRDVDNTTKFSDQDIFGDDFKSINDIASLGIISGYPDGSFRPNNNITRGEVSKLIFLINNLDKASNEKVVDLSVEDSTYWTDQEFIEFMTEEVRYSKFHNKTKLAHLPYINGIFVDKEGKVTFADNLGFNANYDFEKYEQSKWIKPLAYNLTKRLGYYAKENGNHVHFTNGMTGNSVVNFEYYETNKYTNTSPPCFSLIMYKDVQFHAGKDREYNIGLTIYGLSNPYDKEGNLLSMTEIEKIKANNNITDDITEALRLMMVELFGEKDGNEFTKNIVENYIKRVSDKKRKTYVDSYKELKIGKYDVFLSDYIDRTDNTWGAITRYSFIIK